MCPTHWGGVNEFQQATHIDPLSAEDSDTESDASRS